MRLMSTAATSAGYGTKLMLAVDEVQHGNTADDAIVNSGEMVEPRKNPRARTDACALATAPATSECGYVRLTGSTGMHSSRDAEWLELVHFEI